MLRHEREEELRRKEDEAEEKRQKRREEAILRKKGEMAALGQRCTWNTNVQLSWSSNM